MTRFEALDMAKSVLSGESQANLEDVSIGGQLNFKRVESYIKVEIKGKLQTGVIAIGGETTGVTINANNITWDLDGGGNPKVDEQIQAHSGKISVVKGTLTLTRGVEIPNRYIVLVTEVQ